MNGFKFDLTQKILGLNPHVIVESNGFKINDQFLKKILNNFENIKVTKSYSGEGVIVSKGKAKGIIIKGINPKNSKDLDFFKNNISKNDLNKFRKNTALIGAELAYNLNLKEGDMINLMSSSFISTPFGALPKQIL